MTGISSKDACISMTAKRHSDEEELLADLRTLERINNLQNEKSAADAKIFRGAKNSATLAKEPVARPVTAICPRKPTAIPTPEKKQGATLKQGTRGGGGKSSGHKVLPVWEAQTFYETVQKRINLMAVMS